MLIIFKTDYFQLWFFLPEIQQWITNPNKIFPVKKFDVVRILKKLKNEKLEVKIQNTLF